MNRSPKAAASRDHGVALVELLVAVGLFAVLLLMVDSVFITAHRGARTAELGADVDQNARVAVERISREVREASALVIVPGGSSGRGAVVFKSARFSDSAGVFCLDVVGPSDPLYDANCWTVPGPAGTPGGTYLPIWQRYIGYYVVDAPTGELELRRYTGDLAASGAALPSNPDVPPGGAMITVVATGLQSFDVVLTGNRLTVSTTTRASEVVQGSSIPPQQIQLEATVLLKN